jgi:hypothetical protein
MKEYCVKPYDKGKLCIFRDDEKVGEVRDLRRGISSQVITENITDILNCKMPRHRIDVGASPQYILANDPVSGFEIRVKDEGVMGQASTLLTFDFIGDYADTLKGRLTPDFFVALCNAMPAPEKPKQNRNPRHVMS